MTFSEFAKLLYPFCGGGERVSDFVLLLIDNIMEDPPDDDDEDYNPLAHLNVGTLEKYYNGSREFATRNASTVFKHLDKGKFADYINDLPPDTISVIANALHKYGFDIDTYEVGDKCADIFADILERQANPARSIETNINLISPTYQLNTILDSDLYLLMETNNTCPLCRKPLVSNKNNNTLKGYEITHITPSDPTDEVKVELGDLYNPTVDSEAFNNKIALCLECANTYKSHTTQNEFKNLVDIKDRLIRNYAAAEILNKMYLEEQIEAVIRRISNVSLDQLSDKLNYEALRVRDKIPMTNIPLLLKTENYVVHYYKFIKSVFSQLEREGKANQEDVAHDVLRTYRKLYLRGLSQDEIYKHLTGWFKNETNAQSVHACEILVAFFVQNCEVFHALTQ